jgi:DNA-binding IclR family transcriptional regulator
MLKPKAAGVQAGVQERESPSVAQRILMTLEACASQRRSLTLAELVEETGLAKTTLHRTCWKLVELGLLEHSEDGFSVGVKMFALGNANPVVNDVRVAAMPLLLELQKATGAMSNLAILHDGKALIVDALYDSQERIPRLVGASLPLHCTAVGKAIAANLDADDREQLVIEHGLLPAATWRTIVRPGMLREHLDRVAESGVAASDEEFMDGVCGVAAAMRIKGGATVAIGFVGQWKKNVIAEVTEPVRQAAATLQAALAA